MREAEARQLQAVLTAIAGRDRRRCQVLQRVTMRLLWAGGGSYVALALALLLSLRFPSAGSTIIGLAAFASLCTQIPWAIIRAIEVHAADRYRTKVIETALE